MRRAPRRLAALAALAAATGAQESRELRAIDVTALALLARPIPIGVELRRPLAAPAYQPELDDAARVPLEAPLELDGEGWTRLIAGALGEERVARLHLEVAGGLLLATGPPAELAAVERVVADVAEHLLREVDLELAVLAPDAVPAGTRAVLTSAEADALLAGAEPLDSARLRARVGHLARLGAERLDAWVAGYDLEVGQWTALADPLIAVLREGTEVGAVALAEEGGGWYLRAWGRRMLASDGAAEGGERREVPLPLYGDVPLRVPRLATALAAGSARVEDGGAIVLGQDFNGSGVWVLRARRVGPAREASSLVAIGRLGARPLLVRPVPAQGPIASAPRDERPQLERASPLAALVDAERAEWGHFTWLDRLSFEELLAEARLARGIEGDVFRLEDELLVSGPPALAELVRAQLRALSEAVTGTVSVEARCGLMDRALARSVARGAATAADLAALLPRRLIGACELRDSLLLCGGAETLYLADFDPLVAPGAGAGHPILAPLTEGVSFWLRPARAPGGAIAVQYELEVQVPARELARATVAIDRGDGPSSMAESMSGDGGRGAFVPSAVIELPAVHRAALRGPVVLPPDAWTLLGLTEIPGSDLALIAVARFELLE